VLPRQNDEGQLGRDLCCNSADTEAAAEAEARLRCYWVHADNHAMLAITRQESSNNSDSDSERSLNFVLRNSDRASVGALLSFGATEERLTWELVSTGAEPEVHAGMSSRRSQFDVAHLLSATVNRASGVNNLVKFLEADPYLHSDYLYFVRQYFVAAFICNYV